MSLRLARGGSGSKSSSSFLGRPVLCPEIPSLSLRSASSLFASAAFLHNQNQEQMSDRRLFEILFCRKCTARLSGASHCLVVHLMARLVPGYEKGE